MEKLKITIDLELLPEDFLTLTETAGREGMTTAELLEAFIADLTLSSLSHGSDERDLARQWLTRCGFRWLNDTQDSFLTWLIDTGNYGDYETYRSIARCYEGEEAAENDPPEDLQEAREGLDRLYTEYCEDYRPSQGRAEAFRNADRWTGERYILQYEAKTINTD